MLVHQINSITNVNYLTTIIWSYLNKKSDAQRKKKRSNNFLITILLWLHRFFSEKILCFDMIVHCKDFSQDCLWMLMVVVTC